MRKLGFWETLCQVDQDHRHCCGMLQQVLLLKGPLTQTLAQSALAYLQAKHPMLQGEIIENDDAYVIDRRKYQALSESKRLAAIPLHVHKREDASTWRTVSDTQIAIGFEKRHHQPSYAWRAHLILGQNRHELLFLVSHGVSDALSTATLMRDFLDYCGTYDQADHPLTQPSQALLPAFESRLPPLPKEQAPLAALDRSDKMSFEANAPLLERQPRHLFHCIDPATVTHFVKACKREGVSVNSGLSAAWLKAVYPTETEYGNLITAINLRQDCQPPVANDVFGGFVLIAATEHNLQQPFWDLARDFADELKADIATRRANGFIPRAVDKQAMIKAAFDGQNTVDQSNTFLYGPGSSNIGRLDFPETYGSFALDELYFGTSQNTGIFAIAVSIITVLGKLCCCFSYPEPLLSKQSATQMMETFVGQIQQQADL